MVTPVGLGSCVPFNSDPGGLVTTVGSLVPCVARVFSGFWVSPDVRGLLLDVL